MFVDIAPRNNAKKSVLDASIESSKVWSFAPISIAISRVNLRHNL